MTASDQQIILHSLIARDATMTMDLKLARDLGYDGIELSAAKMRAFLAGGWSEAELAERLRPFNIPGIGFLLDIERNGADHAALMQDAAALFHLAKLTGAKGVQAITGPVSLAAVRAHADGQPVDGYRGTLGLTRDEQIRITTANLVRLSDMAAEKGLILYFEALAWCPLNRIVDQLELLDRAGRPNLKMVVDFWHCYASGDTPEDVARIDRDLIYGIHLCDSHPHPGGLPDEGVLRDVPTGKGALNLREWVDAVKSTGYVGWWSGELFCRRQHQDDSFRVAAEMKTLFEDLVL
ncbi:sugar phosphate isomerase/epimerase [Paracoccus sp. PAR01]|nr:sugar phosphate isomerase/epimerase [Paracoccus sp. PAR01]